MSEHGVYVVRLGEIKKHPEADTLGLVEIQGYTCVIRLAEFKSGDLAVYIEPDYVTPGPYEHPAGHFFGFLKEDQRRIRVRKFRGIYSQGLLIPCPVGSVEGDNVMELLGIKRYDPYAEGLNRDAEVPIDELAHLRAYDLENIYSGSRRTGRRWKDVLEIGEDIVITEKLHGQSARYAFREGRMWAGSRTEWKRHPNIMKEARSNIFWDAVVQNPWIEEWCRVNPDKVLYGEVIRTSKKMHYGIAHGVTEFYAFDVLFPGAKWMDAQNLANTWDSVVVHVPVLYIGVYTGLDQIYRLAEGDSRLSVRQPPGEPTRSAHFVEGVVVKPAVERFDPEMGRVALKVVGLRYLEKS